MRYQTLNNGVKMPMLGFGVYNLAEGDECVNAVKTALEAGYRTIDTAAVYYNEKSVGTALRESGVPREEIFLTTKLSNPDQREGKFFEAFDASLDKLGVAYVDLYLIHWPCVPHHTAAWQALEKIAASGRARAVGVSNFQPHHLADVQKIWQFAPALNQVEMHPFFTQKEILSRCRAHGIALQSWSPLGGNRPLQERLFEAPPIADAAVKYGKTPAQIILRWNMEIGVITIPKSQTPTRIRENIDIFDFTLTPDEVAAIDALNRNERVGPDPDNFDF